MILDSSAIVAVFLHEPEADMMLEAIASANDVSVSSATVVESGIVLSHRKGKPMQHAVELFFHKMHVRVLPFTEEHSVAAMQAWWRYGRTRSPAALNFGDCIAYATAQLADEPLLCKGNDFNQTDLKLSEY